MKAFLAFVVIPAVCGVVAYGVLRFVGGFDHQQASMVGAAFTGFALLAAVWGWTR